MAGNGKVFYFLKMILKWNTAILPSFKGEIAGYTLIYV